MYAQTQTQAEPEAQTEVTSFEARWPLLKRVAFRFAFAYAVLYFIPFALDWLPFYAEAAEKKYEIPWHLFVPWVGKHVLHLGSDITVFTNGSGDTTYDYVLMLCCVALAAVATVLWSLLDRRRPNYERLYQWLRLYVRFLLASLMINYGASKVIPLQMPAPYLTRLIEPYGESSPMGLLWTFIGASKSYEIFAGSAEMLAGVLLIFPRTALLGALAGFAVSVEIFALNMCYDVPVKILSFHLVLMSAFLIAQDFWRLTNVCVLNRGVGAARARQLFERRRLNQATLVLQVLFGLYLVWSNLYAVRQQEKEYAAFTQKPPLYGIWMVDEFSVDDQARSPLTTDTSRWQRVIFQFTKAMTVQPMSGANQTYLLDADLDAGTLTLGKRSDPNWKAVLSFKVPEAGAMTLEGDVDGHKTYAKLTRFDESKYLLTGRGFHWIQEAPFNR
jgi:hypothetical protein